MENGEKRLLYFIFCNSNRREVPRTLQPSYCQLLPISGDARLHARVHLLMPHSPRSANTESPTVTISRLSLSDACSVEQVRALERKLFGKGVCFQGGKAPYEALLLKMKLVGTLAEVAPPPSPGRREGGSAVA